MTTEPKLRRFLRRREVEKLIGLKHTAFDEAVGPVTSPGL